MTKLLQEAIERLKELPAEEQDAAADMLIAYISSDEREYVLNPSQVAEVRATRERLRSGDTRLATDTEVALLKRKTAI